MKKKKSVIMWAFSLFYLNVSCLVEVSEEVQSGYDTQMWHELELIGRDFHYL